MSIEQKKNKGFEDAIKINPNLELANQRFLLSCDEDVCVDKEKIKSSLMEEIIKNEMAPFYQSLCEEFHWLVDDVMLQKIKKINEAKLIKFKEQLEDAKQNAGESEIREALLAKADYLCFTGEKDLAITAYLEVFDKSVGVGNKLDVIFSIIRICLFFKDSKQTEKYIDQAKNLIETGGDWDRRNRLKVYDAYYRMSIRDFKTSANLFLDALPTFTCLELMDYKTFIKYTVICAMIALDRVSLKKKVIDSPEILEVINEMPGLEKYINTFYRCKYDSFFLSLADLEKVLKGDRLLHTHYRFYIREMRIKAYAQHLESYKSLTLDSMASSFGVKVEFLDAELSRFIAAGRISGVIDKVSGIIETNRPDLKNAQYQSVIKQGDALLNRIQKLSRVINV